MIFLANHVRGERECVHFFRLSFSYLPSRIHSFEKLYSFFLALARYLLVCTWFSFAELVEWDVEKYIKLTRAPTGNTYDATDGRRIIVLPFVIKQKRNERRVAIRRPIGIIYMTLEGVEGGRTRITISLKRLIGALL